MLLINYKIKIGRVTIFFELISLFVLLIFFSWFIHDEYPQRLISFFVLLPMAWIISKHQDLVKHIWYEIKTGFFSKRMIVFNLIGLQLGTLIALYFRFSSQLDVLPNFFTSFLITAIAIAITEECIFRGIIQPMAATINYYAAPPIAAFMHSAYKVMIFIPLNNSNPNIQSLFIGSLVAFLGLGYLKQFSRSILPAIIAHVVFDVLVYAEYMRAPWWLW